MPIIISSRFLCEQMNAWKTWEKETRTLDYEFSNG